MMMNFRTLLPFALVAIVPLAQAAEPAADAAARKALLELVPQAKIDAIEAAPVPGYRQVLVGGQLVYVSDDGKYLLQGSLLDTRTKRDLTASRLALKSKQMIDAVPRSQHIVFAPAKPKYKITVFTDIDCGYCRKLHSQIAEYNKLGIEVDYLFFPRTGLGTPSYDKAVSVWCAKDRNAAFTAAKEGIDPKPLKCDNPVAQQFTLGTQIGVDGTPAVFAPNGSKIGGYLSPEQMLSKLQAVEAPSLASN